MQKELDVTLEALPLRGVTFATCGPSVLNLLCKHVIYCRKP